MTTVDEFSIKFTRQGLDYLRQILGTILGMRLYDDVAAPILANIELQRREQERLAQAQEQLAPTSVPATTTATVRPLHAIRRGRPPKPAPEASGTEATS